MRLPAWLMITALVLVNALLLLVPDATYRSIVVHHSAGSGDHHAIRKQHRARGWAEIAYHFVLSNGSTRVPAGHLEPTWRYRLGLWSTATRGVRTNLSAIHLCVVGNYEEREVPADLRRSLGHALRVLQARHDIANDRILLHRDCNPTACPGKNITRVRLVEWTSLGDTVPSPMRQQHLDAVASERLALPKSALLILCFNMAALVLWRRRKRLIGTRRIAFPQD